MSSYNFLNLVLFSNPRIIDRSKNKVLISFETEFSLSAEEKLKGETCFLFHLDNDNVFKWIHKEIEFREGVPFIDPYFSSALHYFLKENNFDLSYSNPLEVFLSSQTKNIQPLKLLRCFNQGDSNKKTP